MNCKDLVENIQNNFHLSLRNISNSKDKTKELRFGKILLSLKRIQISCELIEGYFFSKLSTEFKNVEDLIRKKIEKFKQNNSSEIDFHNQKKFIENSQYTATMSLMSFQSFLNAYSLIRKNNSPELNNFSKNTLLNLQSQFLSTQQVTQNQQQQQLVHN